MEHLFPSKEGKGFICIYPYMRKWKIYFFKQRRNFKWLTNVQKCKSYVNFKLLIVPGCNTNLYIGSAGTDPPLLNHATWLREFQKECKPLESTPTPDTY